MRRHSFPMSPLFSWRIRTGIFALALVAAIGCSGSIGGRGGGEAGASPGSLDQGGESGQAASNGGSDGAGADFQPAAELVPLTTRLARLSHQQWENTVRDLLFLTERPGLAATFTGDAAIGRFDNGGGTLRVTDGHFVDYQGAAETMAMRVANDPALRAKIVPANLPSDADGRARGFVTAFGRRAFRRPLTSAEVDRYAALFGMGPVLYGTADPLIAGVRAVIEAMLQSPHFLYRTELQPGGTAPTPLSPYEIAARLSFALTSTMPDNELAAAADGNRLGANAAGRAELKTHAMRLLATAAGREMVEDFHTQYLRLRTYDGIDKNVAKVPEFVAGIGADMRNETLLFANHIFFTEQGGVRDLLLSPVSFINNRLAKIYVQTGTFDDTFKKVTLDPAQRTGLLTQAGFLAANAHRDEVDSIHRGVFVHRHILCSELPDPAPNVPPVPAGGGKTNRQRVNAHTGEGTCGAACHATLINPAGFAFEAFDSIGKHRTIDNGEPVDASGTMPIDGEDVTWRDAVGFAALVAESDSAHRCFGNAWLEYLQGRSPVEADTGLLDRTTQMSRVDRASIGEMVLRLLTSDAFVNRGVQ